MRRTYKTCALATLLSLTTGCTINLGDVLELPPEPSDPEVDAGTDPPDDVPDADVPDATPDGMADVGPDAIPDDMSPDACVPLTECPADACGELGDGCGGTLSCAPCACADGVLTAPSSSCGPCGWGTLSCAPGATGAAVCSGPTPEELGLTQAPSCAERVVYLDVALGEGGSGSREDPFGDFFTAYYDAQDLRFEDLEAGPVMLVMTEGTTALDQAVVLKGGVMILGGFTRDEGTWTYPASPSARTVLDVARADGLSYTMGLFAQGVDEPTLLSHLDVQVADALGDYDRFAGASSYGLRAIDSSGLTIANSRIRAGQGGNGGRGLDGVDGADGVRGETGGLGTNQNTAHGGACLGGSNPCEHYLPGWVAAFTPTAGEHAPSRLRGGAGGGELDGGPNRYTFQTSMSAGSGGDGSVGADGGFGLGGTSQGMVDGEFWNPLAGQGEDGEWGTNGGGGGGGGSTEYIYGNDTEWSWGTRGGGGGSGGCTGSPGEGGAAGGGSFGAFLVRSDIAFVGVELESKLGGRGGDGGKGGAGGQGALGGPGTKLHYVYSNFGLGSSATTQDSFARSGDGGRGGDGGSGGDGGGGAGGVSYGAYCFESPGATFVDSRASTGGSADGGGGPGAWGERGLSRPFLGCPIED